MSVWNFFSTLSTALLGTMPETPDQYTPSIQDILAVKQTLTKKGKLPLELVDTIIDFAEYWIKSTTCRANGEVSIHAGGERENKLLLRSYPLGYIPTKDDPTTLPMTTVDEYPSIPSYPWLESGDLPHNVTREVIDYWSRNSLARGEFPCRKIVFTIKSHDQGWGGPAGCRGTYKGSYTWFDVGLETLSATRNNPLSRYPFTKGERPLDISPLDSTSRDAEERLRDIHSAFRQNALPYFYIPDPQSTSTDAEPIICTTRTITPARERRTSTGEDPKIMNYFHHNLNPGLDCVQRNRTGTKGTTEHIITWSCKDNIDPDSVDGQKLDEQGRGRATADGEYVRNLKVGDVVTVWGKARYPGWVNNVEEVKIEVYWAV